MRITLLSVALAAALAVMTAAAAFAQSDATRGESPTVPAPRAEPVPSSGASNPIKHNGMEQDSRPEGISPLEQDPKSQTLSDADFMKEAAISNMAEIAASRLAAERASDPKIRSSAQELITDHEAMAAKLGPLAAGKKIKLPEKLDAKRQTTLDQLAKTDGAKFDRAYLEQMVHDHEATTGYFRRWQEASRDPAVKAFTADALPTLMRHGAMMKTLYGVAPAKG